jgi:LCP family protein required for cell wall assembly
MYNQNLPPKKKSKLLTRTNIVMLVLFFFSVGLGWGVAGAADLINVMYNLGEDGFDSGVLSEASATLPARINILIIGADTRAGEVRARSDALMVASLDRKTGRIAVVSIPRDTLVQIPGHGKNKVNSAYALGGAKLSRQAVETLLGVEIPYYVATNFDGFKDIIDTLGGVTIDVGQRMYYPEEDINLQAGLQQLNGRDALGFVRYRHLPLGDIDRVKNQKKFLIALADEMFKLKTLTKIPQLIPQIQNCVDSNLTPGEMLELARMAVKFNPQDMIVATLPGDFLELPEGSYWQVKDKLAVGLLNQLMEPGAEVPQWQPTSIVMRPPVTEKNEISLSEQTKGTEDKSVEKNTSTNTGAINNNSTKPSNQNNLKNTNIKTDPSSVKTGSDIKTTDGNTLPDSTNSSTNTEVNTNLKPQSTVSPVNGNSQIKTIKS